MPTHLPPPYNALLDLPIFAANRFGPLADRLAALLGTAADVLLIQGEAIVALEAAATSLARPGVFAINIVTSPYGTWFGGWLERGGVKVQHLTAAPGLPIAIADVEAALAANPQVDILAVVHAESASGIVNPLEEIAALTRARGIVLVVDAVASVGGHALDVDGLGIDIAVIGPQKSLGGPAGVSALSVSAKAWAMIAADGGPRDSILSLTDQKTYWLDNGRGALPGTPAQLEFWALEAALDRVEAEGLESVIARHQLAATATRAGLLALGMTPWVPAEKASNLVTAAVLPDGIDGAAVLARTAGLGLELSPGIVLGANPGSSGGQLLRLNHTGPRARYEVVLGSVCGYGQALRSLGHDADVAAAAAAVSAVYLAG